jgi:hypothetical protein
VNAAGVNHVFLRAGGWLILEEGFRSFFSAKKSSPEPPVTQPEARFHAAAENIP